MESVPRRFESFVNSEESKTEIKNCGMCDGLRALLIQKRVKLLKPPCTVRYRLRALLIQKRVKQAVHAHGR